MDIEVIDQWARKDLWSQNELEELYCGKEPDTRGSREDSASINKVREEINRAILIKKLTCTPHPNPSTADEFYNHHRFFRPEDAARWATGRFQNFPDFLKVLDKEKSPSSKTVNKYLQVIRNLSAALIGNLTGEPYKDADSLDSAMRSKNIDPQINARTLGDYLKKAYEEHGHKPVSPPKD